MNRRLVTAALGAALITASLGTFRAPTVAAATAAEAVVAWNALTIEAIHNAPTAATPGAGNTPIVGTLHTAMVQLAVFDALQSIVGGYEPYLDGLAAASPSASQPAAVATAAHHVLIVIPGMPAAAIERLNAALAATLGDIPGGADKDAGIAAGAAAATAILIDRATDGRFGAFRFTPGSGAGAWRPELPAFLSDPNAWVARVRPFTLRSNSQFRTEGPLDLESAAYTADFNEVKRLGGLTDSERSTDENTLAAFFFESPLILWSRMYRGLEGDLDQSAIEWARLFGLLSVASADAAIGCWDDKAHWSFWRPITAIRMAADDGNPDTVADPNWLPLVATPPYPDHPSGFNCLNGAGVYVSRAFFGTDRMTFTLHSNPANADREYHRFTDVIQDAIDVRILQGLHFRTPDEQGAHLGKKVGQWVSSRFLEPTK